MKQGLGTRGYTIVEVMIVMAVSSALLIAAIIMVGGQETKTQFYQAANSIQTEINQTINNTQSGYYAKSKNFSCVVISSGPYFQNQITDTRGTNQSCILVGRAMQFAVGGKQTAYNTYNLAGERLQVSTNVPVTSIDQTLPTAISIGVTTNSYPGFTNDTTEQNSLQYGLKAIAMSYKQTSVSPPAPTGIVAFVTDFPKTDVAGNLNSNSRTVGLYAIKNTTTVTNLATSTPLTQKSAVDAINYRGPLAPITNTAANFVPVDSVTICFGDITNLYAIVTIGGNGGQLTTNLSYANTSPTPAECS